MSTITVTPGAAVTVHTFTAGESGWQANSHLLEFSQRLVLVDAPLLATEAEPILALISRLGLPLDRVLITHPHPDHFATAGMFGAPVHALHDVAAAIAVAGARQIAAAYAVTGLDPAHVPVAPVVSATIVAGEEIIDDVRLRYLAVADAEASHQLVIELPAEGMLFTGDLAYAGVHPFLAGRQLSGWLAAIEQLPACPDTVLFPGHGVPDAAALRQTGDYLRTMSAALAAAATAEELDAALDAAYPDLGGRAMRAVQNAFLFPRARGA